MRWQDIMNTIIYTNINFKRNKKREVFDLILGIIFIIIGFSGLFLGSTFVLKLVTYIIPLILIISAIKTYKLSYSLKKTDFKHCIVFLIQAIILTILSIYIIIFPLKSLNYIVIILGVLSLLNSLNQMFISNIKTISFIPFVIGILCILFSNQIINTFYTLFLLFIGVSKVFEFIYKRK